MNLPWWMVLLGLELPVIVALLDCVQRPPEHFAGGDPDRAAWTKWLVVAVFTVPILLGYGIVIGYYHAVVRKNAPGSPR